MGKIAAVAKLTAKEGKGDDMAKALQTMIDAAEDEPGTEVYVMHRSRKEPDAIWFYEVYADKEAQTAHSSSDAMKSMFTALADIAGAPPEIHVLTPVAGKGIALDD